MERERWPADKITKELKRSFTSDSELNDVAAKNMVKLTAAIHAKRDGMGILPLSRTPRSILMWSHYADQHRGICVEFSIPVSASLLQVLYSQNAPRFTLHDILVKRNAEILALFTTKHQHWRYEQEYRVILDQGDILHDVPGPITAVVFGLRTVPDDESLVRRVASGIDGVKFRRCTREPGRFGVRIEAA